MGKHLLEAEWCERVKVWSCRPQQADAKCHTRVTCFWVFVTRGTLPSPPARACSLESSPGPWPHHPDEKGTSLPCPREPSLASPFPTETIPFKMPLLGMSLRMCPKTLPNPTWLSLPYLLHLKKINSLKSFKILSHYQSSGISAKWY